MQSKEQILEEVETMLEEKGLVTKLETPPNPGVCEWCGGECGVIPTRYSRTTTLFPGWFSPECWWLANCAKEAVENDNS